MIMVDRQQKLHYAINTNNYNLRLLIWKKSLPIWFATNKIHYARYGTFYVKFLEYLEDTHPGAKEEIEGTFRETQHSWHWPSSKDGR